MTLIDDQIRPDSNQNAAISPTLQVLLDFRYLATDTFRRVMGALFGVERATARKKIRNVIAALVSLCHRYVKMRLLFASLHLLRGGWHAGNGHGGDIPVYGCAIQPLP